MYSRFNKIFSSCFSFCIFSSFSLIFYLTITTNLNAEENSFSAPNKRVLIDQVSVTSFEPTSVSLLQEISLGVVKLYSAELIPISEQSEAKFTFAFGTAIPLPAKTDSTKNLHYTFFLTALDGQFEATEVKTTSWSQLNADRSTVESLEIENMKLSEEINSLMIENKNTLLDLETIRNKVAQIPEIDEIMTLKSELANITWNTERKAAAIKSIQPLVISGRTLADPEKIDSWHGELATHLVEAAKVTALSERLNKRRQEAAMASYRHKINLVKEMSSLNPETLAQESLRLRKQRQALEKALNLENTNEKAEDQF